MLGEKNPIMSVSKVLPTTSGSLKTFLSSIRYWPLSRIRYTPTGNDRMV